MAALIGFSAVVAFMAYLEWALVPKGARWSRVWLFVVLFGGGCVAIIAHALATL